MSTATNLLFAVITKINILPINRKLEDFFKNAVGFNFRTKIFLTPFKELGITDWKTITPAFAVKSIDGREEHNNTVKSNRFIYMARSAKQATIIGACKPSKPEVTTSMVFDYGKRDVDSYHLITGAKIAVGATTIVYAQKFNENLAYFLVITKREKKND